MRILSQLTSLCMMVIMVLTSLQTFKVIESIEQKVSMNSSGGISTDIHSSENVDEALSLISESVGSIRGFLDKLAKVAAPLFEKADGLFEIARQQPATSDTQQESRSTDHKPAH